MKKNTKFIIFGAIAAVSGLVVGLCAKKLLKKATKVVESLDETPSLSECADCPMCGECAENGERCVDSTEFYNSLSVPELRDEARVLGIKNIWRMNKAQLVEAIVEHNSCIDVPEEDDAE